MKLKGLTDEQSDSLRENLVRFGEVEADYFSFRVFEAGGTYEKLTDMPVVVLSEMGGGLNQFEIHFPTYQFKYGREQFQQFTHFDRGDLRLLSLIVSELSLQKVYFPIVKGASQLQIPKSLDDDKSFSGVLAALTTVFGKRDYQFHLSLTNIPKPKGLDRAMMKRFDEKLSRMLTIAIRRK